MRAWLMAIRVEKGLKKAEGADRMKITRPYYIDIENGDRQMDMTYSMMEKLASALDVPVSVIIDGEKEYVDTNG